MYCYCRLAVLMAEKDPRLTQRSLARQLKLGVATVGRLHNNNFDRVDRHTIEKLCIYFDCQPGDLFVLRADDHRFGTGKTQINLSKGGEENE